MTTAGDVSQYSLPTTNAGPSGIAAGPDGALWFTELFASKVGSITTDTTPDPPVTGPPGPPGADANVTLVAFEVKPKRPRPGKRVKVRYAITEAAEVSLSVARVRGSRIGAAETVTTGSVAAAGVGKLVWNGKLDGKRAKAGRYQLTVIAQSGDESASSSLKTRLRKR